MTWKHYVDRRPEAYGTFTKVIHLEAAPCPVGLSQDLQAAQLVTFW